MAGGGAYTRPIRWEPGTFLRPCDLCGIRFRANQLIRSTDGKFRCLRWCVEETQLDRDRASAAASRRREAPPPPFGAPYLFKDIYSIEGVLFDFLANNRYRDTANPSAGSGGVRFGAPPETTFRNLGLTPASSTTFYSFTCAGEAMRYLYGLIVENKRPTSWIVRAKAKLRELADYLIGAQVGFGTLPSETKANSIRYGMLFPSSSPTTSEAGSCGLGLMYAYMLFGDVKYLTSARAVADWLTNMQQGGLLTSAFSSTDSAGANRINYGTWTRSCDRSTNLNYDHVYRPDSLVCLEFLKLLYATVGDEMHGADTTLSGVFIQAPQQLLSTSIASARAFWSVGCFDAVIGSAINGLSTTTPRELFNSFPTTKTGFSNGTGSWEYQDGPSATGTLVTAANYAIALRALYAYEGYSTQVSSIWTWLMGFTSNSSFQPTTTSLAQDAPTVLSLLGTYNPKLCLSTTLQVRATGTLATVAMNGSSQYDWQCVGLLAPIQGVQDPGSLDTAKDYMSKAVSRPEDYDQGTNLTDYLMCQGLSGLSGQIAASPTAVVDWRADLAAKAGQAFRYGNVVTPTVQV